MAYALLWVKPRRVHRHGRKGKHVFQGLNGARRMVSPSWVNWWRKRWRREGDCSHQHPLNKRMVELVIYSFRFLDNWGLSSDESGRFKPPSSTSFSSSSSSSSPLESKRTCAELETILEFDATVDEVEVDGGNKGCCNCCWCCWCCCSCSSPCWNFWSLDQARLSSLPLSSSNFTNLLSSFCSCCCWSMEL